MPSSTSFISGDLAMLATRVLSSMRERPLKSHDALVPDGLKDDPSYPNLLIMCPEHW